MLEPIMDLTLELSLPLTDFQAPMNSPTIYSSASDGSLHFPTEGVGGWRMAIPDMDVAFADLELDDMIEENANLIQGLQGDLEHNTTEGTIVEQQEGNGDKRTAEDCTLKKSSYKHAALLELQIEEEDGKGSNENEKEAVDVPAHTKQTLAKGKLPMTIAEGGTDDLGEETARVRKKVDTTMEGLAEREGCRKMKKAIETSSDEVRRLACLLNTSDSIDAIMLKEDGAVMFISSESSGDSGQKKRKRRERVVSKAGAVASRLRKKDRQVANVDAGEDNTTMAAKKKIKKMAVRKIRVSAARPTTSITLAPPMPGLPTS